MKLIFIALLVGRAAVMALDAQGRIISSLSRANSVDEVSREVQNGAIDSLPSQRYNFVGNDKVDAHHQSTNSADLIPAGISLEGKRTIAMASRTLPCPSIKGMCKLHKEWPVECAYICKNIVKHAPRQDVPSLPLPTDYCSTVVYHTNLHRMNHSALPVTYNQSLAVSVGIDMLACPAGPIAILGSNYAGYWGTGPNPYDPASATVQAIHDWYETERITYAEASNNYTTPPALPPSRSSTFRQWGHFSNMVWASSTQVGCWSRLCGPDTEFAQQYEDEDVDWSWMVVCANGPPGNTGDYTDNVKPPVGLPPSDYSIQNDSPCD